MTVVILLLECFSERPTDVLVPSLYICFTANSVSYRIVLYLYLYTLFAALYHTYMYFNAVCH